MRPKSQLLTAISVALWFFVVIGLPTRAWAQVGPTLYFPHLGNGVMVDGTWQTNFVFVNNTGSLAQGTLDLYGDDGAPLVLGTNRGSGSTFNISIPAYGTYEIETDGVGSLKMGWARADFDHAVIGSAIFSLTTGQGKMVSSGVLSIQEAMISFLSPATDRTGIALANIYDMSNTVDILALDPSGNVVAETELTLGPGQHMAKNLIDFFPPPSVGTGFRGSVYIFSTNSYIAALAIGFEFNTPLYVSWSYSNIAYDPVHTAFSGTFSLIGGPAAGGSGTITASNLEHFDSNMFTGNISTTMSSLVRNGVFLGTSDDFGLEYTFYLAFDNASNRGLAVGELQSDGSFVGYIVDDGEGNYGTFTLTPVAGSGYTLRAPGQSRPPKKDLTLWGRPKARQ
jgi:hypothetical protein